MKKRDLLLVPAAALGVMIANVAISFGIVWVYATFFNPGQPFAHYEAFAAATAPIHSVIAGIPLMLAAGYWLAKGRPRRGALLAAGAAAMLYVLVDLAILLGSNASGPIWGWPVLSQITKILSALAGAALRTRHVPG